MSCYRLVRDVPFKNEHAVNASIIRFIGRTGLIMAVSQNQGAAGGISSFKNIRGEWMNNLISADELKQFFIKVPEEVFNDASWRTSGSVQEAQTESLSTVKELKELTFNVAITKDNYEQAIAEIKKVFK